MVRCLFILLTFSFCLIAKEPIRPWTSADGRTLEARYLEMVGSNVRIENESGRKFTAPLTGFSQADQEYVKKVYRRSLFTEPQPFDDDGRGGVIVASAKGKVEVIAQKRDRYTDKEPYPREVIVGESIGPGATLITGSGAGADLLLTNGTLAHLGENTKLVLTALYQKSFKGTKQKASELTNEVSPSRTALKLEEGDLILEVRKLSKESSFLVSTEVVQTGIRGTQFKVSASSDSAELAVLEGRVDFLDSEQISTPVETAKKAVTRKGVPTKLKEMSKSEQTEVKQAVEQAKSSSASIDLKRLANAVHGYSQKNTYFTTSIELELIWCPPGSFIMGDNREDSPAHSVVFSKGFYLSKYEVTQKQYEMVMKNNPSEFKGEKLPVEMVSWQDAVSFCDSLTKKERKQGWEFSLPTEAQWEYACRAGTTTAYYWGDTISASNANWNHGSDADQTEAVGQYSANQWGFFDMHGNVWEWTADWYGAYPRSSVINPRGPSGGTNRVRRGGSWNSTDESLRSALRSSSNPSVPDFRIGFRVALMQVD
jgi:formylglycine-generating enzyme required for sulfatase activity